MSLLLLVCVALGGCTSKDAKARDAYARYQSAAAANDMVGAQQALMQLVAIDDRVANYWVELAKIQAASGNGEAAYHSFTRAYELDRRNPSLLRVLTEFALRGGDPAKAQQYAQELDVIAPGDPWVMLTQGYVALRESRFDEVLNAANQVLETSPFDSHAKGLKVRALLGKQEVEEAIRLLNEQINVQPDDLVSLQILSNIYEQRSEWAKLYDVAQRLAKLQPDRQDHALLAIEAAFKSGREAQGRRGSLALLGSGSRAGLVRQILDLWELNRQGPGRVADAIKLGQEATDPRARVAYADFLNRVGSPDKAFRLVAPLARYPIAATSAEPNAVAAEALGLNGKVGAARKRLDDVLDFDPGNAVALRARSQLLLRTGDASGAVKDAEKLVSVAPAVARHWLLLARAYTAAGESRQAERALWDAFRDIPGDEQIYAALASLMRGNPEKQLALRDEFARQNEAKVSRGLL